MEQKPTSPQPTYRVRFAPLSDPGNIQRGVHVNTTEAELRQAYAATGCEVLEIEIIEKEQS